jgi:ribonuclease III
MGKGGKGIEALERLEATIGVSFKQRDLLRQSMVHRSYLNETPGFKLGSNERLEFLGDAVLDFIVADDLYKRYPDHPEGELTSLRAALVRLETLGRIAARLNLGDYLLMSRGEQQSGGRDRETLLGRAFEALIGAMYLDMGLEQTRSVVLRHLTPELSHIIAEQHLKDPKSRLQERAQADFGITPSYRTVLATGPEHAKEFTVEVNLGDLVIGRGAGRSKQHAAQEAAKLALDSWPPPGLDRV